MSKIIYSKENLKRKNLPQSKSAKTIFNLFGYFGKFHCVEEEEEESSLDVMLDCITECIPECSYAEENVENETVEDVLKDWEFYFKAERSAFFDSELMLRRSEDDWIEKFGSARELQRDYLFSRVKTLQTSNTIKDKMKYLIAEQNRLLYENKERMRKLRSEEHSFRSLIKFWGRARKIEDQNEKEYARSKALTREKRENAQIRRTIKDQRNRINSLKASLEKAKAELNKTQKKIKTLDSIQDQNLELPMTWLAERIFKHVDHSKSSDDFNMRCILSSYTSTIDPKLSDEDLIREVVRRMVCEECYVSRATLEDDLSRRVSRYKKRYEDRFSKLPLLKGKQIPAFKSWLETIRPSMTDDQLKQLEVYAKEQQPSETAELATTCMKLITFVIDITVCKTWKDVIICTARMLSYTATPKMMDLLINQVGTNLKNFLENLAIECTSRVSDQNMFDDAREAIRVGIGISQKIQEIPLAHFVDQVVCMAVFLMHDAEVIPESKFYKDLLHRATVVHGTDTLSLVSRVCTIADTALMIMDTIYSGHEYLLLINPLNIDTRLAKLEGLFPSYKAGNLDILDKETTGYTVEQYENDIVKLAKDIEIILEKKMIKPGATRQYTLYLSAAVSMKNKVLIYRMARQPKAQPYFVALYGEPGIGKTGMAEKVQKVVSIAYDRIINPEHVWKPSEEPNGWHTGAKSNSVFMNITEHMNKVQKDNSNLLFFNTAVLCDTTVNVWNQPDLETKGQTFNWLAGACIASNVPDFGLPANTMCVGAVNRRVDFFRAEVNPKYGKTYDGDKHLRPDPEKIPYVNTPDGPMQEQNIHLIQQYRLEEQKPKGDKTGKSSGTVMRDVGMPMNDAQWVAYMLKRARKVRAESERDNENIAKSRKVCCCYACGNPRSWCICSEFVTNPVDLIVDKKKSISIKTRLSQCLAVFKDRVVDTVIPKSIAETTTLTDLLMQEDRFLEDKPIDQNWKDYGLIGEVVHTSSPFLLAVNFTVAAWVTYILGVILSSVCKTSLQSVFNLRTALCVSLPFIWNPPLALIIFSSMYFMACSVGTVTEFLARRVVCRNRRRGIPNRYWNTKITAMLSIAAMAAGAYVMYTQFKKDETAEDSEPIPRDSDEVSAIPDPEVVDNGGLESMSSEFVKDRLRDPHKWENRVVYVPSAPINVRTATVDQVHNIFNRNSAIINTGTTFIRALIVMPNVLLLPIHMDEVKEGELIRLNRIGCQGTIMCHVTQMKRIQSEGRDTDLVAALINIRLPVRSIVQYFDHDVDVTRQDPGGCLLYTKHPQPVLPIVRTVATTNRTFLGLASTLQVPTQVGDCGIPLIRATSPCVIVGMHVALAGESISHCVLVSKRLIDQAISSFVIDQTELRHENLLFDNVISTVPKPGSYEPATRVATRWLRSVEDKAAPFSVTVYGYSKERVQNSSEVGISFLSPFLEAENLPKLHGRPPLNTNRAASKLLQMASRNGRPRSRALQKAVTQHYAKSIVAVFKRHSIEIRPLSYHEAFSGVFGNGYAKPMNLSTACGGGFPGKKRTRVTYTLNPDETEFGMQLPEVDDLSIVQFEWDALGDAKSVTTADAVVDNSNPLPRMKDDLREEVEHIMHELANNRSCHGWTEVALKDEPISCSKLSKGDFFGRPITSQPMAHHVVDTILFGMILSYLRLFPLQTGCWEGISPMSEDWHEIMTFIGGFEFLLDMDTKKMDQSMNYQDIYSVFEVLAMVTEELHGISEFTEMMRSRGCDLACPIINLFGECCSFYMNTSGNKLTININDIGGVQLRVREAYLAYRSTSLIPDFSLEDMEYLCLLLDGMDDFTASQLLQDFDENVRVGSVGDDAVLSTKIKGFNLPFISAYFEFKGVTITGAAKTDERLQGMLLSELQCCKRGVKWHPEAERLVGPLDEASILRSLHCTMPSQTDPLTIEHDVVKNALEEYVLHGKDVYEARREQLRSAILKAGHFGIHSETLAKTYEDNFEFFISRFPTSSRNRTPFDPFLKDQNGLTNQRVARVVTLENRLRNLHIDQVQTARFRVYRIEVCEVDPPPKRRLRITNQNENIHYMTSDETVDRLVISNSTAAKSRTIQTSDTLTSMVERPVKLREFVWAQGALADTQFNPWSAMFTDPIIVRRFSNYRHFRGKLRLKVMVDGTQFHYGLAWMTYNMLHLPDAHIQLERGFTEDLVEMSQRPRINISPRDSQGGELLIPFVFPRDFADIIAGDMSELGSISLTTIVPLRVVNDTLDPVRLTVFGSFEDVELYTPTVHEPVPVIDQNDVAIVDLPTVGSTAKSLSLEPLHTNAAPSTTWANRKETAFGAIGGREALIDVFTWDTSNPSDYHLASYRCSPFHGRIRGSGNSSEYHVTPACYLGLPYTYWRGTVRFRFEIVCSRMHRGRLKFTYDPIFTKQLDRYNTNYTSIVDIGSQTEHTANIGWAANTTFLNTITGMTQIDNSSTEPYTSAVPYANGVITASVVSPLISPTSSFGSQVQVLVYASMGPDYELSLLRRMIPGTRIQTKNIPPAQDPGRIQASNPPPGADNPPPISANLTRSNDVILCEAPFPMYVSSAKRVTIGGRLFEDQTYDALPTDDDWTRIILDANGTYDYDPYTEKEPMAINVRGFVAGPTNITVTATNIRGGLYSTSSVSVDGITGTAQLQVPAADTPSGYQGTFSLTASNRFQVELLSHKPPRFLIGIFEQVPNPARNSQPLSNGLQFVEGSTSLVGAKVSANQSFTNRTNVVIRFNPPATPVISRICLSYQTVQGSQAAIPPLWRSGGVDYPLINSAAGRFRIISVPYTPDSYIYVPPGQSISVYQLRYFTRNDAAIRTAIKDQNEISGTSSVETYGPPPVPGISADFFQEVHTDIMHPLSIFHTFMSCITNVNNSPTAKPGAGAYAVLIPHYPQSQSRQIIYNSVGIDSNMFAIQYKQHLLEYFMKMFACVRGGIDVQLQDNGRFNKGLPWAFVQRVNGRIPAPALTEDPFYNVEPAGAEYLNMQSTGTSVFSVPWYNQERFGYARSDDAERQHKFFYHVYLGANKRHAFNINYRAGKDFSLTHFVSTPILII